MPDDMATHMAAGHVPAGWTPRRVRSDWWILHTLTHRKCGWTSEALDLRSELAGVITDFHTCREEA